MQYKRLGQSGLQVSQLSYGSWLTFANQMDQTAVTDIVHLAFEQGINFFDTAEAYAGGQAEILMGHAFAGLPRNEIVVSTKIFWGGTGPNQLGLSRKHIMEGTQAALQRLQQDYVDLIFCHRPDPDTPMEETVRAMDDVVRRGWAFYWGTSEWSAEQIHQAHHIAHQIGCVPPTMEQPQYNLFHRMRVEQEYSDLYTRYGLGTTIWSPLASGVLTGKYLDRIPEGSRFSGSGDTWIPQDFSARQQCVKKMQVIAKKIDMSLAHLSLAWCLRNPHVSTVILGASNQEQLTENLSVLDVLDKIPSETLDEVEEVCQVCSDIAGD